MAEPQLWVEIFVDYRRVLREPIDLTGARFLAENHLELCAKAVSAGLAWRVEVSDPEGDIEPMTLTNTPETVHALPASEGLARMDTDRGFRLPRPTHLPECPRCGRRILDREERHPTATPFHVQCQLHKCCYILCDHDGDGRPILEQL